MEVQGILVDPGMEVRGEVVDPGVEVQEEVVEQLENLVMGPGGQRAADQENVPAPAEGGGEAQVPLPPAAGPPGAGMEMQVEVMEQLENLGVGPGGQWAADPEKVPVSAEGAGEAQAPLPQDARPPDSGMEVREEVMEQLKDLAVGPGGQRAADPEKVQGPAEGGGEAQAPLPPAAGPPGAGMEVQVTEQLENVAVGPGGQRVAHQENVLAPAEDAGEAQAPLPPATGPPGAGMDVQGEVVEQLENLAMGPGGQRAAPQEKVLAPAEGGGEAQAPLPPAAGPPGAGMEMQVEVMEQLENLAVGPGGQRAAHQENVLAPAEGAGEAHVPLPPATGPPRSPPPAWPGSPSTAVSSSDSESDTDSDSSSTSLFSSSSALSDEDDFPNEKDNRPYCIRTKDEVPIDKLPPVEDLTIILPDNVELKLFGTVSSIIEQLVIIESLRGLPPVNEESIIFKEDRQAVGKIFEIFGPVSHPFYVIRFNNSEHIKEKGINVQDSMYFAPSVEDFTQYIFAEKLKQEKGSDASWKNDQEPPSEVLDFSDDEKEREAKLKKKKPQSQGRKKVRSETLPSSENKEHHHSVQQPAPSYSRGYRGRGFSWGRFPPPSGPQGFFRPAVGPPQLYSSDRRIYQESPMFPPPPRRENPMMQQYAFPPPDFGYASNGHQFHPPPSNTHMMWTGPDMYNSSYSFLPPPPPPPPPPESYPPPFRPY